MPPPVPKQARSPELIDLTHSDSDGNGDANEDDEPASTQNATEVDDLDQPPASQPVVYQHQPGNGGPDNGDFPTG